MMPERANRTFICSVLFLDIAEYSKRPVSDQIQLKNRFNARIADAIRDIDPNDRIILDTGDGVAINFLGDPEDTLFVAMSLRESFTSRSDQTVSLPARIGINLGPVRLVRDLNDQPNIIGDGINVAQRVMAFAQPGQILVSRSYFEVVSHISESYSKLFIYEGSRTDKHVREHEVYSVGYGNTHASGISSPAQRALASRRDLKHQVSTATIASGTNASKWLARLKPWFNSRTVAFSTATLCVGAFLLAVVVNFIGHDDASALSHPSADGAVQNTSENARSSSAPQKSSSRKSRTSNKTTKPQGNPTGPESGSADPKEAKFSPFSIFSWNKTATEADESAANTAPATGNGSATISLAISPWGEVFVDGKRIGVSPPVNLLEVEPGRRMVEVRNGTFPVYSEAIDLKADQKVRLKHKFN